jgi:dolichol-phosphate mannosyltransferase
LEKLVILPTYNEKENIGRILAAIFNLQQNFHVLVIDDGSPDGTAQIVKELLIQYPGQLFIEERKGKLGLGTAYIHGFKWALVKGYRFIFEIDADFSHNPSDLPRLYNACKLEGADVAVGSRYIKDGGVINWPWDRIALSKGASVYTRMITWMPVKDPTAGFVCYKIKEVPIIFQDRTEGISKMNKGIIKEGVLGVLKLRWNSFFKSYRKKLKNKGNELPTLSAN